MSSIVLLAQALPKEFLVGFENSLSAEFFALSQNTNGTLAPDRTKLLAQYFNFIEGFHEGLSKAADVHYRETLNVGFGLGYSSGFRDGYSAGYATGYQDGLAAGNKSAWAAANLVTAGLQTQIANLQTQLQQAQAAQSGGGGAGGGFWSTVGNVANAVDTAVGVIGSLFGTGGDLQ